MRLVRAAGPVEGPPAALAPRRARLAHRGVAIAVDLDRAEAVFTAPSAPTPQLVLHPQLASVASLVAHWEGNESLHCGATGASRGAWGVVGARGTGKSTTLAGLAARGVPVLCDDVLVLHGRTALAGPRAIDLRADAARCLGTGTDLGVLGTRERWRVTIAPVAPELELCGWVFLDWGDDLSLDQIRAPERLARLSPQRGVRLSPPDPSALLELARLPGYVLRRPRALMSLPAALDLLASVVA